MKIEIHQYSYDDKTGELKSNILYDDLTAEDVIIEMIFGSVDFYVNENGDIIIDVFRLPPNQYFLKLEEGFYSYKAERFIEHYYGAHNEPAGIFEYRIPRITIFNK